MADRLSPEREAPIVEQIKQALSEAGAFCGECGFEPGDRGCRDCEACWKRYADDLLPIVRDAVAAELAAVRAERDEALARVAELDEAHADAVRVSGALNRRLSQEQLAGSALYAALTMPTTPQQRQDALDKFTAVAQQIFKAGARS